MTTHILSVLLVVFVSLMLLNWSAIKRLFKRIIIKGTIRFSDFLWWLTRNGRVPVGDWDLESIGTYHKLRVIRSIWNMQQWAYLNQHLIIVSDIDYVEFHFTGKHYWIIKL